MSVLLIIFVEELSDVDVVGEPSLEKALIGSHAVISPAEPIPTT